MGKIKQNTFLTGWLIGLAYFLFVFRWLWDAYPLEGLGISSGYIAFLLLLTAWLTTSAVSALFWGFAMGTIARVEKKTSWLSLIVFPSIFTAFEFLRTFAVSFLWSGPGNGISPHWTFGNLAYKLNDNPLALKISSLIGIYGVLFILILSLTFLFILLEKRRHKEFLIALTLLSATFFLPFFESVSGEKIKVAIIQTEIPTKKEYSPQEQLAFFKKELEMLETAAHLETEFPSVVVFPEGSNFFTTLSLFGNTLSASQYFYNLFPSSVIVIDNSQIQEDTYLKSKTILLDSKKGIVGSYDKHLLTPNGEYIPYVFRLLNKALGTSSEFLEQAQEFKKGDFIPSALNLEDSPQVGVLVCSDIFSTEFSRNISLSGGKVIVAQASFGFVNGSKSLISHTKAAARFRAAENSLPLVYASNYGTSFVVSGSGKVLKESQNRGFEILTENIVLNGGKTLYNKLGDWPILLASLGVLISSFFLFRKN